MAEGAIISSALKNTHLAFYDLLAKQRLTEIDLSIILVSMVDTADARLLTLLAGQLDMLGYNGWVLAENDDQRRALLKSAVDLHRMKGTPGGIQEVLKRLGFVGARIEEGWENFTDGSADPGGNSWAYFRIVYNVAWDKEINEDLAAKLFGLIESYKPARSKLANFSFNVGTLVDKAGVRGEVRIKVIDVATNTVTSDNVYTNRVYGSGLLLLISSVSALSNPANSAVDNGYRIHKISFGTSGTANTNTEDAPAITNPTTKILDFDSNNLGSGSRHEMLGPVISSPGVRHFFSLNAGEGNGKTYREFGLVIADFIDDGAGYGDFVLCRVTRGTGIVKTSAIRIEGTWDLHFDLNV